MSPAPELLCETCGYPLRGLAIDAECPECGRSLQGSLPSRRHGSPAQRERTWRAWLSTVAAMFSSPRESFRTAAIETRRARGLLLTSTFVASGLGCTSLAAVATTAAVRYGQFDHFGASVTIALSLVGAWAIMIAASWIESLGIRFFGARRGWRISGDVALVVVAHAAAGWVAGGVVVAFGSLWALVAGLLGNGEHIVIVIASVSLVMGAVIGLVWFEMLVYTGVRECKYANPPGVDIGVVEGVLEHGAER